MCTLGLLQSWNTHQISSNEVKMNYKSIVQRKNLKIQTFLNIAKQLSRLSTCKRLSVGAVITDQSFRVLSTGYNGRAHNMPHCNCKDDAQPGQCDCIHRQQNRVLFAGHDFHLQNKKLFVTVSPCLRCRKILTRFNVRQVYFIEQYRDQRPLEYLGQAGIYTQKVTI